MQNNDRKGQMVLGREIFCEKSQRRPSPKPNIQSREERIYYQLFPKASYVSDTKIEKTWQYRPPPEGRNDVEIHCPPFKMLI